MVNYYISRFKFKGVKNIKEEITLNFYNQTITDKFDKSFAHIKAIYGPNGSGKSAIIHAVKIYQSLVLSTKTLYNSSKIEQLNHLMNNESDSMSFEVEVLKVSDLKVIDSIFIHSVILKRVSHNDFVIEYECIEKVDSPKSKKKIIVVEVKSGVIALNSVSDIVKQNTLNLLHRSTFTSVILDKALLNENPPNEVESMLFNIFPLLSTIIRVKHVLLESDKHENSIIQQDLLKHIIKGEQIEEKYSDLRNNFDFKKSLNQKGDYVPIKDFEKYEESANRLASFLQLFKPNLQGIILNKNEDGDQYFVEKVMNYGNSKVDFEFESAGIKKLAELFGAIERLIKNKSILFIDEFDSSINDVYLVKLIEYLINYSTGQLVFTTHNVSPMKLLKNKKHSLDFMTIEGKIVQYTRNGNYQPANLYHEGMIKDLPFNIESYDFIKVFGVSNE